MKDNGSESMRTMGSLDAVPSLLNAVLVDRFRVVVFPVITGNRPGPGSTTGTPTSRSTVVSSRTFDGRLQLLKFWFLFMAGPPGTRKDDA